MFNRNYVTSLAEKVRESTEQLHSTVRMAAVSGMTTAMLVVPSMSAYASEVTPPSGGTNVLEGTVMEALSAGFGNLAVTFTQIIAIGVVTGLTIATLSAGAKYAVKYVKGLLSQAA